MVRHRLNDLLARMYGSRFQKNNLPSMTWGRSFVENDLDHV